MITLIIKSYLTIFISVGLGCLFLFLMGLFFIFKRKTKTLSIETTAEEVQFLHEAPLAPVSLSTTQTVPERLASNDIVSKDFSAIAGDNVFATQLDLARAYIETGKKVLATNILHDVLAQGSYSQKQEAAQLLNAAKN